MSTAISRLGYVYRNDDLHYTQDDLRTWLPVLISLNTRWLTLYASSERTVPEHFLGGIIEAGIEPVILIRAKLGETNPHALHPLLRSYARWGVHYVVVYDRPNLRGNWNTAEWNRRGIVERFLDRTIPLLEYQQSLGLKPVFAPLEPGGDYWDTAFLRSAFESLVRRGKSDLLESLHLGVYAWTYDKPLGWGAGGPSQWPEARPYHTPSNCQDQIGFRTFEWYAELTAQSIGRVPPMLVIAGGAVPDLAVETDHTTAQIEQNVSILRALNGTDIPEYVLNFAFYCLSADSERPGSNAGWFTEETQPKPIVEAIQKVLSSGEKKPAGLTPKSLDHYVLLPNDVELNSAFAELSGFIQQHKPVLGFSKIEARMAHKVTLVGGESEFPRAFERDLADDGCLVDRITTAPKTIAETPAESIPPRPSIKYSPLGGS
ncbi:MAG: hypothetical protein P8Z41_13895 [Anaerolineales bacterium]